MRGFDYLPQGALRFPEAVQVAVGVDGFDLVALADGEADLGRFAGLQGLALVALPGLQGDPLNVVLREHGMLDGADGNGDGVAFHLINRHMLLQRCVGRAGDDLGHFLTAAHDGDPTVFDHGDDVAAMLADVKFLFHVIPPDCE